MKQETSDGRLDGDGRRLDEDGRDSAGVLGEDAGLDGETVLGEGARLRENIGRWVSETGKLDAQNRVDEGVTVSTNRKLFQAGQSGNPLGRPKSDLAMLKELRKEYPPVVIINMLNESYELARTNRAPKAMLGVVELILAYQLGKPKVSITHEKGAGATYLEMLQNIPAGSIVTGHASTVSDDEQ
jgi:hypothetical protein